MGKSKQARKREFSYEVRQRIISRDRGGCIFCAREYHMEDTNWYGRNRFSIMHYIPRSKNGMGIAKNGALGCQCHHEMLDNGNKGRRAEMLEIFKAYLQRQYPDNWSEDELIYSKWQ